MVPAILAVLARLLLYRLPCALWVCCPPSTLSHWIVVWTRDQPYARVCGWTVQLRPVAGDVFAIVDWQETSGAETCGEEAVVEISSYAPVPSTIPGQMTCASRLSMDCREETRGTQSKDSWTYI